MIDGKAEWEPEPPDPPETMVTVDGPRRSPQREVGNQRKYCKGLVSAATMENHDPSPRFKTWARYRLKVRLGPLERAPCNATGIFNK